jgi:hypothetical protein
VRVHHQSACDRHALLLPARELVRELVGLLLEPTRCEQLAGARLGLRARRLRIRRAASVRLSITRR